MKLSIITINYNNGLNLNKTIDSVVNQTFQDFEYIIIDGGSSDISVDVILKYKHRLAYWVSEPDMGIYHAMNKGIEKAVGEYLLMLNSGDLLLNKNILDGVFGLNSHKEDILIGDVCRSRNGEIFENGVYPSELTFNFFRKSYICHQGTFIKRHLHNLVGLYDENLKFASDWKFFILAICRFNSSYKHLGMFVTNFDCGGVTCNSANYGRMRQERNDILKQFFPTFLKDYAYYDHLQSQTLKGHFSSLSKNVQNIIKGIKQKMIRMKLYDYLKALRIS